MIIIVFLCSCVNNSYLLNVEGNKETIYNIKLVDDPFDLVADITYSVNDPVVLQVRLGDSYIVKSIVIVGDGVESIWLTDFYFRDFQISIKGLSPDTKGTIEISINNVSQFLKN